VREAALHLAFEIGYCWRGMLIGQTLEDSRAVSRTLGADIFDGLNIDASEVPGFEDADIGIYHAKRAIRKALAALASDASPRGEAVGYVRADDIGRLTECDEALIWGKPFPGSVALYAHPAPATVESDDVISCLLAEKPFWFDPATNFVHADDGGGQGLRWAPVEVEAHPTSAAVEQEALHLARRLFIASNMMAGNPLFPRGDAREDLKNDLRNAAHVIAALAPAPAPAEVVRSALTFLNRLIEVVSQADYDYEEREGDEAFLRLGQKLAGWQYDGTFASYRDELISALASPAPATETEGRHG